MSEANKAAMRRLYEEVFGRGNMTVADEILAADFVEHEAFPGMEPGIEGFKQMVSAARSAFPDFRLTAEDLIAEGDRVAVRYTMTGTHRGEFMGAAPTGNQIKVSGMEVARFAGGKVVEHWGNTDTLGLMQQLGLMPSEG